jgi:TolB protein
MKALKALPIATQTLRAPPVTLTHPTAIACLIGLTLITCARGRAWAQGEEVGGKGIEVPVSPGQVSRVLIALPPAINQGGAPDTIGLSERLITTVERGLVISGYFDLLEKELYPADPSAEGLNPSFPTWFNVGAQGLIKAAYSVNGDTVSVTLKLFDVDGKRPVVLDGSVDEPVTLSRDPSVIQAHVARFVDQVIKHYTGSLGFLGTSIVAVRRSDSGKAVVRVTPDGAGVSNITTSGKINILPSLSKGRIYFTSYRDNGPHLFLYERGTVKSISARSGINTGGVLSPNGNLLAATLSYEGSSDIYLLDPNTGDIRRRLTMNRGIDISPTWSPDGSQIAFVSDREGTPQVWVMNADGSGQRRVTFLGRYNQSPAWSPKGDQIAFTSRDEKFVFDIFTIDPKDSSKITRLTQNQGNNEEPSWSPDGRHLVFSSTRSGRAELYIMTSDGFTQRQLTTGGGFETPYWGE